MRAVYISRFTNLQVAITLSFVAHALLLFQFGHFSKALLSPSTHINDFHLPVSVELVRYVETSEKTLDSTQASMKVKNELIQEKRKSSFSAKNLDAGPIYKIDQSSAINPNIKPTLPFHKNQLVSFTKAPASSAKSWNRAPVYPESARRLGREGRVILDAQLDAAGKVVSVQVARSSGSTDLDQAAIEAVREWTMDLPKDGTRRLFIPITFRFNSNS